MHSSREIHTATPWRLLPLLMAMTAIGPATLNIVVPALPGMITRLGTDAGTVQLTLSLYLLSLACAQLVLGPLSDRFGRRPVVLFGLALLPWAISRHALPAFIFRTAILTAVIHFAHVYRFFLSNFFLGDAADFEEFARGFAIVFSTGLFLI